MRHKTKHMNRIERATRDAKRADVAEALVTELLAALVALNEAGGWKNQTTEWLAARIAITNATGRSAR